MNAPTTTLTGPSWVDDSTKTEPKKEFKLLELEEHCEAYSRAFLDSSEGSSNNAYGVLIGQAEKGLLSAALEKYNGNISKIAVRLGINRATVAQRLKVHGFR